MSTDPAIDDLLDQVADWRGAALARMRALIQEAVPEVEEAIKWRRPSHPGGVPVWSKDGMICTGEVYKDKVRLTFAQGAALQDPTGLFNAGFGGGTRRAIDIHAGDEVDAGAFRDMVLAAASLNAA